MGKTHEIVPAHRPEGEDPGLDLYVALRYILVGEDGTVVVPPPPVMPAEGVTPLVLHVLGDSPDLSEDR